MHALIDEQILKNNVVLIVAFESIGYLFVFSPVERLRVVVAQKVFHQSREALPLILRQVSAFEQFLLSQPVLFGYLLLGVAVVSVLGKTVLIVPGFVELGQFELVLIVIWLLF